MQNPSFSIATPVRNALEKLRRCVGSVRGQTGIQVEHLIQDACSHDGAPEWLERQAQSDRNLRPVSRPDDGMYDAINRAWARSHGGFLAWLNADEQYLPGTLARVQEVFASNPHVDAVFGDYLVVNEAGQAIAVRREIPLRRFYVVNSFLNAQSCTIFFRRHLLENGMLYFDTRYRYAADKELILNLLDSKVRFLHVPEVWSAFGVDGENLSTHAGMASEAEEIRLEHGGFRWKPLRLSALLGRRVERLFSGAYRNANADYLFALDEVPNYRQCSARKIGGRYSIFVARA